jgi:hypothetical protein
VWEYRIRWFDLTGIWKTAKVSGCWAKQPIVYRRLVRQVLKMRLSAKVTVPQVRRPQRAEILKQLERTLSHPLFKNSHRYPKLLQHVVRRTLEGRQAELKVRTIGIAEAEVKPLTAW